MKRIALFFALAIASTGFTQSDNPGSLWNDHARSPFADRKAARPGDILTVLIQETSSATSTAATSSSKSDSAKINAGIGPILSALIPDLQTGASASSQGQGSTTRSGRLQARLTVTVKEVLPNGNLVIEGTRFVQMNKETQKLVLTGIVRPDDIRADNTILSENVAEGSITYDGKGTVGDRQRRGIIATILSWLF